MILTYVGSSVAVIALTAVGLLRRDLTMVMVLGLFVAHGVLYGLLRRCPRCRGFLLVRESGSGLLPRTCPKCALPFERWE